MKKQITVELDATWVLGHRDDEVLPIDALNRELQAAGKISRWSFIHIDAERELVRMMSQLPFTFSEAKRLDGAIATSQANYKLVDGNFDYDFATGKIFFRLTSSFRGSLISKDLLNYMIDGSCYMVDEFNDKFLMIDKGLLTVDDVFRKK